jgi:hypothetical protein
MREKLNSNPLAQAALVGVLLLAVGFFVLSSMGGESEEAETTTSSATVSTPEGSATVTATVTTPAGEPAAAAAPSSIPPLPPDAAATAPPLPHAVTAAFHANRIVVVLFVSKGGIDDGMVAGASSALATMPGVSTFVVPADRIAKYAAIAQGVAVDRVPALVVLRPKRLDRSIPTASVHYGFQSPQSVVQAVIDAGYKGRTVDYHP